MTYAPKYRGSAYTVHCGDCLASLLVPRQDDRILCMGDGSHAYAPDTVRNPPISGSSDE